MIFYESPRFPDCISFGAQGGPEYFTDVVQTAAGFEYRNENWTYPLHKWTVGHDARLDSNFAELRKFFRSMRGRSRAFRFKDWMDYKCPDDAGAGRFAMLTATTFQMFKLYDLGSPQEARKIVKPVEGTISVVGGTVASINYTTGVVTMTTGTPSDWTGQFDVPCRFDADVMQEQIINKKSGGELIVGWSGIPIVEVRL